MKKMLCNVTNASVLVISPKIAIKKPSMCCALKIMLWMTARLSQLKISSWNGQTVEKIIQQDRENAVCTRNLRKEKHFVEQREMEEIRGSYGISQYNNNTRQNNKSPTRPQTSKTYSQAASGEKYKQNSAQQGNTNNLFFSDFILEMKKPFSNINLRNIFSILKKMFDKIKDAIDGFNKVMCVIEAISKLF